MDGLPQSIRSHVPAASSCSVDPYEKASFVSDEQGKKKGHQIPEECPRIHLI